MVRPANQLQLSEAEMKEEHTRVLTANDPNGERYLTKASLSEIVFPTLVGCAKSVAAAYIYCKVRAIIVDSHDILFGFV